MEMDKVTEMLEDFRDCPHGLRDLVLRFPPDCLVRAKKGNRLGVPAPGQVGRVMFWGTEEHPLPPYKCPNCDEWHTTEGDAEEIVVKAVRGNRGGVCLPDQIEVVRYGPITPEALYALWSEDV